MKKEPNRWRAIDFILPTGAIRRAASSIGSAARAVKESARFMGESLPGQAKPTKYEEDDPRGIANSRERFAALYELEGWSEAELNQQVKAVRRTKITAICMSIFAIAGVIVLATTVPAWMAIFLIPASGSLLILGFAQAFKYAQMETQIALRDLISAREFVSRDDFWVRLFG